MTIFHSHTKWIYKTCEVDQAFIIKILPAFPEIQLSLLPSLCVCLKLDFSFEVALNRISITFKSIHKPTVNLVNLKMKKTN